MMNLGDRLISLNLGDVDKLGVATICIDDELSLMLELMLMR